MLNVIGFLSSLICLGKYTENESTVQLGHGHIEKSNGVMGIRIGKRGRTYCVRSIVENDENNVEGLYLAADFQCPLLTSEKYPIPKMVFVCPPKEESEGKTKLLNDLKNIFDEVEKKLTVSAKPICVPCCIPICELPRVPCPWQNDGNNVSKEQTKPASVPNPPEVMVCYKVCQRSSRPEETSTSDKEVHRVRQSKSRELRASILYTGCDCEKRDGLQDDCQRTGCHGSPECLTNPPTCGPSEFCNAKHLGRKLLSSRKDKNGNGKENGSGSSFKAKYKCFPAVVNDPVSCCPCPQK